MGRPLYGPRVTVDDVRAATEAVAVALEIVNSRIANWALSLPDTVADNASSGAVALGPWVPFDDCLDLANAHASLSLNGTEIDSGVGSAVMGDPAAAVAWLANALAPLAPRSCPVSSSCRGRSPPRHSSIPVTAPPPTMSGLGTVSVSFT